MCVETPPGAVIGIENRRVHSQPTGNPQRNPPSWRCCPLVTHRDAVLLSSTTGGVCMGNDRWRRRRERNSDIGSSSESSSTIDRSCELDEIDDQIAHLFDLVTRGLTAATAAFLTA